MPQLFKIGIVFDGYGGITIPPNPVSEQVLGTLLRFDNTYILGTPTEPISHDLNLDYTGFTEGQSLTTPVNLTIYHHSKVVPSFLSDFSLTGSYDTTYKSLNTIIISFTSLAVKTATITVTPNSEGIDSIIPKRNLVWEGLRRNTNVNIAPDTSQNPVHGFASQNIESIGGNLRTITFDNDGNVGFGQTSLSNGSGYSIPHGGKINLQTPFAFSFWTKNVSENNQYPYPEYDESTTGRRCIAFGVSLSPYAFNGFRVWTPSFASVRLQMEFFEGASASSARRIEGDANFDLSRSTWKHIFCSYDGTTMVFCADNQHTLTKALEGFVVTNDSDFFIGNQRANTTDINSWRGSSVMMRDVRWYNGYIPTEIERTQLYNHGLLML